MRPDLRDAANLGDIVQDDVPELIRRIQAILPPLPTTDVNEIDEG
jgi:hypothetical protein